MNQVIDEPWLDTNQSLQGMQGTDPNCQVSSTLRKANMTPFFKTQELFWQSVHAWQSKVFKDLVGARSV